MSDLPKMDQGLGRTGYTSPHVNLEDVRAALEKNRFEAYVASNPEEAKRIVLDDIVAPLGGGRVSWGGSVTLSECGLKRPFFESDAWDVINIHEKGIGPDEKLQRRRAALMSELYLLGTNAVTENGVLLNLDMIGNRVAALTFGPEKVVVVVGRNKIVPNLEVARDRIQNFASPANAARLNMATPCVKTGRCHNCSSDERICNNWTITEKSFPPGRTAVVLVDADLGL